MMRAADDAGGKVGESQSAPQVLSTIMTPAIHGRGGGQRVTAVPASWPRQLRAIDNLVSESQSPGEGSRAAGRTILSSSGRKLPVPLTVTFSRVAGGRSPEQRFCAGQPQPTME
jgi:hypothetical protein